ncbi:MAG: alpha-E domain-containing protein [Alicyclobacillaceae bacterium]|jgi:uncharacterized alpha-E superfamily protein|uniref:alpha-E domain-containing protein n=1 Tax=Alicyclobacillus sp. SP_1 TaxID=2942475 RepID=UPI0021571F80|nr:alpha-E domain-containing protein [Alicyclobacillus sp. SP_1]MCY0887318.1 alpha-E domain-containing protein [Alicyclobacillaceae bacterium]MCY0897270.1 alpha-E domain-containing protein [Alicyclobacillaceae bacterium]
MLSRVADALYWMARNVERAENDARLIAVQLVRQLEHAEFRDDMGHSLWSPLIHINASESLFLSLYERMDDQSSLEFLTVADKNPNSILRCVSTARQNARTMLGMIPSELWELVNTYYYSVREYENETLRTETLHRLVDMVKSFSLQFWGIIDAAMSRGDAYQFVRMGTFLERAQKMARIVDVYSQGVEERQTHQQAFEYHHWSAVLQSVSAHESYVLKHGARILPERVGEYLLLDPLFPRSIRYCLEQMLDAFLTIEHGEVKSYARTLHVQLGKLCAKLQYAEIEEILQQDFHAFLANIQWECNQVGQHLATTYYLGAMDAE